MNCPDCNKSLKTRRTFDAGRTVERDRHCDKCNVDIRTIEHFVIDVELKDRDNSCVVQNLERLLNAEKFKNEEIYGKLKLFKSLLECIPND